MKLCVTKTVEIEAPLGGTSVQYEILINNTSILLKSWRECKDLLDEICSKKTFCVSLPSPPVDSAARLTYLNNAFTNLLNVQQVADSSILKNFIKKGEMRTLVHREEVRVIVHSEEAIDKFSEEKVNSINSSLHSSIISDIDDPDDLFTDGTRDRNATGNIPLFDCDSLNRRGAKAKKVGKVDLYESLPLEEDSSRIDNSATPATPDITTTAAAAATDDLFKDEDDDDWDDLMESYMKPKLSEPATAKPSEPVTVKPAIKPEPVVSKPKPTVAQKPVIPPNKPAIPGNKPNKPTPPPRRQAPSDVIAERPIPRPRGSPVQAESYSVTSEQAGSSSVTSERAGSSHVTAQEMNSADILKYIEQEEDTSTSSDLFAD